MPKGETASGKRLAKAKTGVSMVLLTGPSGSGKTTLARGLERRGWEHLDGDALAKSLYVPGSALMREIKRAFGLSVLRPDGSLDALRLGEIVFPSLARRKELNRLVFPRFLAALRQRLRLARKMKTRLVADVAVYFDLGAPDLGLPVVLVDAALEVRVRRLKAAGLDAPRARVRASALRFTAADKRAVDFLIDGSLKPRDAAAALNAFLNKA